MNTEKKKSCNICQARPVTCFERVCNSCMIEIYRVLIGGYAAYVAAYRIERVTRAIAEAEEANCCKNLVGSTHANAADPDPQI